MAIMISALCDTGKLFCLTAIECKRREGPPAEAALLWECCDRSPLRAPSARCAAVSAAGCPPAKAGGCCGADCCACCAAAAASWAPALEGNA